MPPLAGIPKSKAYNHPIASQTDELKYRTKYKQLKIKCNSIEEENVKLQMEIFQAKRNIQRLRLERSILYEHLAEKNHPLKGSSKVADTNPSHSREAEASNVEQESTDPVPQASSTQPSEVSANQKSDTITASSVPAPSGDTTAMQVDEAIR